jgi:hypothetical protein
MCGGVKEDRLILGYEVFREKHEVHPAGRARKMQVWRAPALGCVDLERRSFVAPDGSDWKLNYERRAKSIDLGEPPPELFRVPPFPIRSRAEIVHQLQSQP